MDVTTTFFLSLVYLTCHVHFLSLFRVGDVEIIDNVLITHPFTSIILNQPDTSPNNHDIFRTSASEPGSGSAPGATVMQMQIGKKVGEYPPPRVFLCEGWDGETRLCDVVRCVSDVVT
jgi:hypothetical protein